MPDLGLLPGINAPPIINCRCTLVYLPVPWWKRAMSWGRKWWRMLGELAPHVWVHGWHWSWRCVMRERSHVSLIPMLEANPSLVFGLGKALADGRYVVGVDVGVGPSYSATQVTDGTGKVLATMTDGSNLAKHPWLAKLIREHARQLPARPFISFSKVTGPMKARIRARLTMALGGDGAGTTACEKCGGLAGLDVDKVQRVATIACLECDYVAQVEIRGAPDG